MIIGNKTSVVSVLMELMLHRNRDRHHTGHWVGTVSLNKGRTLWKPVAGLSAGCQGLLAKVMLHWNPEGWGGISRTKEGSGEQDPGGGGRGDGK